MPENNSEINKVNILTEKMLEIKQQDGIIGYILRGSKSASIDLKDPKKIIDYAIFSSTAFEVSQNLTDALELGEVNNLVVEGEELKLLSMRKNDHRISIFMEKNVDHNKLYNDLK